jgi:hypothetical protein
MAYESKLNTLKLDCMVIKLPSKRRPYHAVIQYLKKIRRKRLRPYCHTVGVATNLISNQHTWLEVGIKVFVIFNDT